MTAVENRFPGDAPKARKVGPRRVAGVGVTVVMAMAAAVWLYIGSRPELGPGSWGGAAGGVSQVGDRYELDGSSTGTVHASIRNTGNAPVTLVGVADDAPALQPGNEFSPLSHLRWGVIPEAEGPGGLALSTEPIRLTPGEEAYVELGVHAPRCVSHSAGTRVSIGALPLQVRSLGLTSVTDAPLSPPVTIRFTADQPAAGDCR